jgi:dTDP-4-dehydrorhamnose 3,5-epimerase-like enzyme
MQIIRTDILDVVIIEPKVFGDPRGFFLEAFQSERYAAAGIKMPFLQDNLSRSSCGVLGGAFISKTPRRRESWSQCCADGCLMSRSMFGSAARLLAGI